MNISIEVLFTEDLIHRNMARRLKPLYRVAYADAPYHYDDNDAEEFVQRFDSTIERDDFRLVLGTVDGELAGFSYGYIFPRNLWWRGARDEPSDALISASKYAVIELVVDPAFRGNGFSRVMLDRLLKDRHEQVATLLAKPGALAHGMYQRWGWTKVGEVQSYPHWPVDDAFLLPLNGQLPADLLSVVSARSLTHPPNRSHR